MYGGLGVCVVVLGANRWLGHSLGRGVHIACTGKEPRLPRVLPKGSCVRNSNEVASQVIKLCPELAALVADMFTPANVKSNAVVVSD